MNLKNYYFGQLVNAYVSQGSSINNAIKVALHEVEQMLVACPYVPEFDYQEKEGMSEELYGTKEFLSDEQKKEIMDKRWKEDKDSIWLLNCAKNERITIEKAQSLYNIFLKDLYLKHDIGKGMKEIHRHFTNWVKYNKLK